MSVCFVVVPMVVGGWPLISAAILAAGATMGYQAVTRAEQQVENHIRASDETVLHPFQTMHTRSVELVMSDSNVVADTLMRGEKFVLQNGDMLAEFYVDGRGACHVHMTGTGYTELQLETAGRELMDKVRQQFAYAKVMQELEAKGFNVTQQEVEANGSIRVRVQRM